MARNLFNFTNTVKWKLDRQSWNNLKKQSQKLGKELGEAPTASMVKSSRRQEQELLASRTKLADKLRKEDAKTREQNKRQAAKDSREGFQSSISGLTQTSGLKASQTLFAEKMRQEEALAKKQQAGMDSHVNLMRKRRAEQEKFAKQQEAVIKRFMISNKEIRDMSELERKVYVKQLKQAKTKDELLFTERRLKADIADRLRKEKVLTREKQKQTIAQRRLTSSTEQMVGAMASIYTAAAAGRAIMDVGIQFEAIEKSFIVVSGGAQGAAEDFKFVREEAMRLGAPLTTLAENFARMRAAAGDKMGLDDLKDIFIGVNESATALGLNQEKVSKVMLATQQMMSKNKIMAEELTGQMGESLPFALRAMASAAAKAGLIDGTMSQQKQEAALRKLMENGDAIASEILPYFGKELQKLARANNGLAKALEENFNPQLVRAKNNLTELMNTMWEGGLKQSFTSIVKSFSVLGSESHGLAKTLSSFLGGAILGLSFPINFLIATIQDFIVMIRDLTGVTDENFDTMITWTASILGAATGFFALYKAIKLVGKGLKMITGLGKTAAETVEKVTKTGSGIGKTTAAATGGGFLGKVGGPLAAITAWFELSERLATTNERNQNIVDYVMKGKREFDNVPQKQQLEIKFGIDPSGNINPYIEDKISESMENQMIDFYQNLSPSN